MLPDLVQGGVRQLEHHPQEVPHLLLCQPPCLGSEQVKPSVVFLLILRGDFEVAFFQSLDVLSGQLRGKLQCKVLLLSQESAER